MKHKGTMRLSALMLALGCAASAAAKDNPMWQSGLVWTCHFTDVIQCERSKDCHPIARSGTFTLDYPNNRITDNEDVGHAIRRHYAQTVSGSPIAAEVKVELDTNDVLWLLPADAAGMFSNNWIGAMVSPRAGVVIQEMRPIICQPKT